MKQEKRSRITYEKILDAAITEFGTKSYETASLNTVCSENIISKGLVYHHFKSKDDLYLHCVKACFQALTEFMKMNRKTPKSVQDGLQQLLQQRQQFFKENPCYGNIFFNTVLQPPVHLREELREIRRDFDDFCHSAYEERLGMLKLRECITREMALEYFILLQEMFNGYFQKKSYKNADFHTMIQEHEMNLSQILNIMLYGIALQPPANSLYLAHLYRSAQRSSREPSPQQL